MASIRCPSWRLQPEKSSFMLQGTAEKIQKLYPLDTLPVTSAHEQSFVSYLPAFTGGGKK